MSTRIPFLRSSAVQKNVSTLSVALGVKESIQPRLAYMQAIGLIQGWCHGLPPQKGPALLYHGDAKFSGLFEHFLASYDLPSLAPFAPVEVASLAATVSEALTLLASVDDDARSTFDILVRALLIVRIPAFGSLSDALGVVLAGPRADWSRLEVAELLWHEAVHQALFLTDLIEPLFTVAESAPELLQEKIRNPLLGVDRPFDLAFHGVAVSVALLDLHLRAESYYRALEIFHTVEPSLDELLSRRYLLTERGSLILDEIRAALREITTEVGELAIRGALDGGGRPSRRSYLDLQQSWPGRA